MYGKDGISPYFDGHTKTKAKDFCTSQIGFFKFIVQPFFNAVYGIHCLRFLYAYSMINKLYWEEIANDETWIKGAQDTASTIEYSIHDVEEKISEKLKNDSTTLRFKSSQRYSSIDLPPVSSPELKEWLDLCKIGKLKEVAHQIEQRYSENAQYYLQNKSGKSGKSGKSHLRHLSMERSNPKVKVKQNGTPNSAPTKAPKPPSKDIIIAVNREHSRSSTSTNNRISIVNPLPTFDDDKTSLSLAHSLPAGVFKKQ